ncbi:MAG: DUF2749 domain-containing protein [Afipia sp.]|nr:DUF2749 domain-containing protein [Afipia sp.]
MVKPASLLLIVAIVALAVGGGLWFGRAPAPHHKPSGFFDTKSDYDTSGGQQMRPRWKE